MRLAPETKIYSFQEAQKKITSFSEEYDTWYAGVYESGTDNHSINLDLTEKKLLSQLFYYLIHTIM